MDNQNGQIQEKGLALATRCALKLGLEILDVKYVKENGIKILRVIAEGKESLSIDEATALNNLIGEELDKEDFIDEEYYLEVSSAGLERELYNDKDIISSVDKYIYISTYEKVNNSKEFYGYLKKYENNVVTIETNIKGINKIIEIPRSLISLIRWAVKF